jgi:histidine triad (HIT) family protein
MPAQADPACFVCRKHRERGSLLPGGPVAEDELVVVSHLSPYLPGRSVKPVYLGHLFVEPRRHAPGLADLTDAEAERVGWWCTRASRALREVAGAGDRRLGPRPARRPGRRRLTGQEGVRGTRPIR